MCVFFLYFLKDFVIIFSLNNLKWNMTLFIFYHKPLSVKILVLNLFTKCCWPIRLHDSLTCNISRKRWGINLIFCVKTNIEVFYKAISLFLVFISRHAQSTQITILQNLIYISRQKGGIKLIFGMQINIKLL